VLSYKSTFFLGGIQNIFGKHIFDRTQMTNHAGRPNWIVIQKLYGCKQHWFYIQLKDNAFLLCGHISPTTCQIGRRETPVNDSTETMVK